MKLIALALLFFIGDTLAQITLVPMVSQGLVTALTTTLLGFIAAGLWRIAGFGKALVHNVNESHRRGDLHEYRLNDYGPRLHKLDGEETPPYDPREG